MGVWKRFLWAGILCTSLVLCGFTSANIPPVCQCDKTDPFDPREEALISQGAFKNQCVSSCTKRSIHFFDKKLFQPAESANDDNYWVANVSHQGSFWVASIPKRVPMTVIFQFEYTPYKFGNQSLPGGHNQLRFHFNNNVVRLYKQNLDGTRPVLISDIVFSSEPTMPKDVTLDFQKSFGPNYPIVYQMTSLKDSASDLVLSKHRHVEQYSLLLNDYQKDLALRTAIQMGTLFGMHTMYHLLWRNCATEVFQVLNVAENYDSFGNILYSWDKRFYDQLYSGHVWGSLKEAVADFLARYPDTAWTTLHIRGLVDDKSHLMDLEREVKKAPWIR